MPEHVYDKGYKRILSKKQYFAHFMRKYIKVNWVNNIKAEDLTLVNAAFVDEQFRETEADLIYRAKSGDQEVVFYILLELQSKCDHTMPYRLLVYMTELTKRLFADTPKKERERKDFRLPAVVPVVLYNGKQPWTASRTFRDYIHNPERFGENTIDFQYLLLDLMQQDDDYILNSNNALDDIFLMEKGLNDSDFLSSIRKVTQRAPQHTHEDILEIWDWLMDILSTKATNRQVLEEAKEALMEGDVTAMTTNVEKIFDRKYQAGWKSGAYTREIEIAKKMIDMGCFSREQIQEATGLTAKELDGLLGAEN